MVPKSLGATEEFGQLDLREDDVPEQIEYINQFGNHSKKEKSKKVKAVDSKYEMVG